MNVPDVFLLEAMNRHDSMHQTDHELEEETGGVWAACPP